MASQLGAGRTNAGPVLGPFARMGFLSDEQPLVLDESAAGQIILQQRQSPLREAHAYHSANSLAMDLLILDQMCQKVKESYSTAIPIECSHLDTKRVEFTPRLGR